MDLQRMKAWWPWGLVVAALGVVYGPALLAHATRASNPYIFNDDARQQISPFFRYADSSLFPSDYIADYYLDCLPIGFRAIYALSAPLIDPSVSSKVVAYLALLFTVVGVGVTANRLGGRVAAWGAMSLVLGASFYLDRMGGGLPRAFGFPLLAGAFAAMVYGRPKWLAILVWLGALFYPVASVVTGLATAFLLLVLPAADRGDASDWHLRRRLRFLAVVAGVALVLLAPTMMSSSSYAPVITADDLGEYPEAGPGGRYGPQSRAPYPSLFAVLPEAAARGFAGGAAFFEPTSSVYPFVHAVVALVSIFGWLLFLWSSDSARRMLMIPLAAVVGYANARLMAPYFYLPTRYADYSIPLLAVLMASTAVAGFFAFRVRARAAESAAHTSGRLRAGLTFLFCAFVIMSIGGRGSAEAGLNVEIRNPSLYQAIGALPADAVVAGWPRTAIENVPYVARRTALLTYETHQAFHQKFDDAMRDRMRALIDAMLATQIEQLVRLRDEHGVTHLLVYLPHLEGRPLVYFKPFDEWIANAEAERGGAPLLLPRIIDEQAVYRDARYAIVDLRELSDPL